MTAHDPCPGASPVGAASWQHPYEVTCLGCSRLVHFAYFIRGGHYCTRCTGRD